MAATERLGSSTSKCATPTGRPQARNVVAGPHDVFISALPSPDHTPLPPQHRVQILKLMSKKRCGKNCATIVKNDGKNCARIGHTKFFKTGVFPH